MRTWRNTIINLPGAMVSIPVSLSTATTPTDIRLSVVGPEGEKLEQVYMTDGRGKVVEYDSTKRSYDGRIVTQLELKQINERCKMTHLDIIETCSVDRIDIRGVQKTYNIWSNRKDGNARSFAMFVAALKKSKTAAIIKWTPLNRQELLAVYPHPDKSGLLIGVAVAFADEIKDLDAEAFAHNDEKVTKAEIDLACQLLDSVAGNGESLSSETDEAIALRRALLEGKEIGEIPESKSAPQSEDLQAALKEALSNVAKGKVEAA